MSHFRFWRRIRVAPGISVNLSKSGASLSMGPRGAKVTVGKRGVRRTVGVPGTGLYYTTQDSWSGKRGVKRDEKEAGLVPRIPVSAKLEPGFFARLVTPAHELSFIEGCKVLARGLSDEAISHFEKAAISHPDGGFIAGVLCLQQSRYTEAASYLEGALCGGRALGGLFSKYGIDAMVAIPIAAGISAIIGPRPRGLHLALAEAHQALGQWEQVIADLSALQKNIPDDVVVRLSLAEILIESFRHESSALKRVLRLAQGIENASHVHAALLLQKAKALLALGMPDAAREVLTATLRRRKGRPPELMHALRYERALCYEELGRDADARRDLERVFADDPDFEDVAERLGVRASRSARDAEEY